MVALLISESKLNGARIIDSKDNVATATRDLFAGIAFSIVTNDESKTIQINQTISRGHKFSLLDLEVGTKVIKYGEVIGVTTSLVKAGEHVHNHNMVSLRGGSR